MPASEMPPPQADPDSATLSQGTHSILAFSLTLSCGYVRTGVQPDNPILIRSLQFTTSKNFLAFMFHGNPRYTLFYVIVAIMEFRSIAVVTLML